MLETTEAVSIGNSTEEGAQPEISRRALLARAAMAGLGAAVLSRVTKVEAATAPRQPEAEMGRSYTMPRPVARTERQFRMGVIGPAMLSLATSQLAVDKATNPAAREFANFELREAIGVTKALREMKTPVPPMDAKSRAILANLRSLPRGAAFDMAYMKAQLASHEFLRDLGEVYLASNPPRMTVVEMHGRHMATLQLAAFKEHVVHCRNFVRGMRV